MAALDRRTKRWCIGAHRPACGVEPLSDVTPPETGTVTGQSPGDIHQILKPTISAAIPPLRNRLFDSSKAADFPN